MRPCGASYAMQSPWGWAFLDLGLLSTLPHGALIPWRLSLAQFPCGVPVHHNDKPQ
jgi:hypothetical protein